MKPWMRDDTRDWITALSGRLEDIEYYKAQTLDWCRKNDVISEVLITKCLIATCIWVSNMRLESISLGEIYDFLGIPEEVYLAQESNRDINDIIEFTEELTTVDLDYILKGIIEEGV
jgi:hypothetical protein